MTKQLPPFWFLPPYTATLADPFLDGISVGGLKKGDSLSLYNFIFKRVARKAADPASRNSAGLTLWTNEDSAHLNKIGGLLEECAEWAKTTQEVETPDHFMKVLEGMNFFFPC
jgi:hypothetical protein